MNAGQYRVAVVMPVYNEQDGIEGFLRRIDLSSIDDSVVIVCVDDASQDSSASRIEGIRDAHHPIVLVRQPTNRGHGPSTTRAWSEALALGAELVLVTDSDGHIDTDSMRALVRAAISTGCDVVEGRRGVHSRSAYRRIVSSLLPTLVAIRARSWCPDANSPYRVYRSATLRRLLEVVPRDSKVPNLWATVVTRRLGMTSIAVEVQSAEGSVAGADGSTWADSSAGRLAPLVRFVTFCLAAIGEWRRDWSGVRRAMRALG